jgi:hypothetical protein
MRFAVTEERQTENGAARRVTRRRPRETEHGAKLPRKRQLLEPPRNRRESGAPIHPENRPFSLDCRSAANERQRTSGTTDRCNRDSAVPAKIANGIAVGMHQINDWGHSSANRPRPSQHRRRCAPVRSEFGRKRSLMSKRNSPRDSTDDGQICITIQCSPVGFSSAGRKYVLPPVHRQFAGGEQCDLARD